MFFKGKDGGGPRWIVAFLGNPESKYERTRHNAGFMAASVLESKRGIKTNKLKFHAFTNVAEFGGERVLFMRPQTYMNLSGDAVAPAAAFYKIPAERVIVVFDDMSLPIGKLRVKRNGSAGGHNGIKSIISKLGTDQFPRVKIGIGAPPHPDYDVIDWVIGKLNDADYKIINEAAAVALDAVEEIIKNGVNSAMNKYNG
ncbi:MAG: aminoacyl-tRNA hydrolase [Oscillospiraceae bacterium]|nr:aminoacyl-tRNA hydrolase [Oscillospiraceae bacterium]